MFPLNELEARLTALEDAVETKAKALIHPTILVAVGIAVGVVLTLILRH